MRQKLIILTLLAGFSSASLAVELNEVPFAERFPPQSITSKARADEVIEAYEKEIKELETWKAEEDKLCYRKFFVNSCLTDNRRFVREKKAEAKSVWLTARDFIRQQKSEEARKTRLVKEEQRKEWVARQEAIIKNPAAAKKVSDEPDSDIDLSGVQTVDSKVERPLPDRKSSGSAPTSKPREITPEQQEANEKAFAEKEQKRQERIEEREANQPSPPSMDEQEREAAREERRKAIEQRRLENAKKRAERAKEYERQLKLREEQNQKSLMQNLKP